MIDGMVACGVSRRALVAKAGLDREELERPDGQLGGDAFPAIWGSAAALEPRLTLPLEVGLAVPYGAFGLLDYLSGTAETVEAAFVSLVSYFQVASASRLVIDRTDVVRVRIEGGVDHGPGRVTSDLFTLGVFLDRFRSRVGGAFEAELEVAPAVPPAEPEVVKRMGAKALRAALPAFEQVAGCAVHVRGPTSALVLTPATFALPMKGADPRLHQTLRALASSLELGGDDSASLEQALRARLRSALAEGKAEMVTMARALGVSERSLQRRLAEEGTTFHGVVERFRHDEALRLVANPRLPLSEVAGRLGYVEQSSFNRAFRRWTEETPRAVRLSAQRAAVKQGG